MTSQAAEEMGRTSPRLEPVLHRLPLGGYDRRGRLGAVGLDPR